MMAHVENLLDFIRHAPVMWGLGLLMAGAFVEYVFPPFPGDTMVLFGSFLVGIGIYPLVPTFAFISIGSLFGCLTSYTAGYFLQPNYDKIKRRPFLFFPADAFLKVENGIHKWGDWLILGNRFLPGVRAVFLFATGLMRYKPLRVIVLSFISLVCWNSILMFAGIKIGNNWNLLQKILSTYQRGILVLIIGLVGIFLIRKWILRARNKKLPLP